MSRSREWRVGAAIVAAAALVVVAAFWLADRDPRKSLGVHTARFREIGGLNAGAPVTLRGVRVGRVKAVRLGDDDWVEVDLFLDQEVELPAKPAVIAASASLFGEWRANIIPMAPLPDDPAVRAQLLEAAEESALWPGATLPDIGELTAQAARIAGDAAKITTSVETVLDSNAVNDLKQSIRDLANISGRLARFASAQTNRLDSVGADVAEGAVSFNRTIQRLDSSTASGELKQIVENANAGSADLRKAAADLRELSAAARENKVSLERVLQAADSIASRLERGHGTLGLLATDSTLYREATATLQEFRGLMAELRANPRKFLKISVF